jgi:hypothetical protein
VQADRRRGRIRKNRNFMRGKEVEPRMARIFTDEEMNASVSMHSPLIRENP